MYGFAASGYAVNGPTAKLYTPGADSVAPLIVYTPGVAVGVASVDE
jgi:hypothetical protein